MTLVEPIAWKWGGLGKLGWMVLALIVVAAFLLRIQGIGADLPFVYDPDELAFVVPAVKMAETGDLNPHWFGHPGSTTIYLNAMIFTLMDSLSGWTLATVPSSVQQWYNWDPTYFHLVPRLLFAATGAVSAVPIYRIYNHAFGGKVEALAAALCYSVIPTAVGLSGLIRTDILMMLCVLISVYFAIRILDERRVLWYILGGIAIGVGVSTKYTAVVGAIPIVLAHGLSGRGWLHLWYLPVIAGLASLCAAFAASPYLFLDFHTMLANLAAEAGNSNAIGRGEGLWKNFEWYFGRVEMDVGYSFVALALAGIGFSWWSSWRRTVVLMAFPVVYAFAIASLSIRWPRWILPILPFLTLFMIFGVSSIVSILLRSRWTMAQRGAAVAVLSLMLMAPIAQRSVSNNSQRLETDTRTVARDWIVKNIAPGSKILAELYGPQLPTMLFDVRIPQKGGSRPADPEQYNAMPVGVASDWYFAASPHAADVQYIVLSSLTHDRFRGRPEIWAAYEAMLERGQVVYRARPRKEAGHGPTITVIKVTSALFDTQS